jgi:hypothetical protein
MNLTYKWPQTPTDSIIHPVFQPHHLNATHSNISFGIALINIANKRSSFLEQSISNNNSSLSKEQIFVAKPLSVTLPSEATLESRASHENSTEPDFMITLDSDDEDEQANQWFMHGFLNKPSSPSSPFVLESIHDPPYIAPSQPISETSIIDTPSSSNQTCPLVLTTNVSFPPTLLLDSTILQEVCENIFQDLNKLVKFRTYFVHDKDYINEWTRLRNRVDFVMCELQKTSLEAHNQALQTLNDLFNEVVTSMKEIEINRDKEKSKLYLSDTHIYLDASGIISSDVHIENLDLRWLTKLKVQTDAPILEKMKHDS